MTLVRIEARRLTFSYRRSSTILEDWRLAVTAGEMVAITGPSGRGKSTLLYLLGLMIRPAAGDVLINGMSAGSLSDHARSRLRASEFGFVFQDAALDTTRSVIDNVTEPALYRGTRLSVARSNAWSLLERFGVSSGAERRPGQVSGGQAQRIALCRALLGKPPIVLADEPTGNLDGSTARLVLDALREHASDGGAVVIVTHDPAVAALADRVVSL